MSVWKRVRKYASESATSIIHGKAEHEETKATSSRALGDGKGHYLVVLTLADTDYVCDYIRHGGDKQAFLEKFRERAIRPDSIPTCICARSAWPTRPRCCAARPRKCSGASGRRLWIATDRSWPRQTSASSTRSAAPRRNGRMRCASCSTCRWTCCSSSAATTARTPRTSPRWARRSCRPISSATPRRLVSDKEILHYDLHERREVVARQLAAGRPDRRRHHRRRVLPEQSHRGNADPAFRAARHWDGRAERCRCLRIFGRGE